MVVFLLSEIKNFSVARNFFSYVLLRLEKIFENFSNVNDDDEIIDHCAKLKYHDQEYLVRHLRAKTEMVDEKKNHEINSGNEATGTAFSGEEKKFLAMNFAAQH